MAAPICKCKQPTVQKITRKAGPNQGRPFWACAATDGNGCTGWIGWAGPVLQGASSQPSPASWRTGPAVGDRIDGQCHACRSPITHQVIKRTNTRGNAGRTYYKCDNCGKFEWLTPLPQAPQGPAEAKINFYAITDPATCYNLQALVDVPPGVGLGRGRDYLTSGHSGSQYDYLTVCNAWRIIDVEKRSRFEAFKAGVPRPSERVQLRPAYEQAMAATMGTAVASGPPLERDGSNEVLLLHGTKPQHLHSILFGGLDPQVASDGLFGRGVYFAEDAAKADQWVRHVEPTLPMLTSQPPSPDAMQLWLYLSADAKNRIGEASHPLHALHHKLYGNSTEHPGCVYYLLVCRVVLGDPVRTRDGQTQLAGSAGEPAGGPTVVDLTEDDEVDGLFAGDERRTLRADGRHVLIAEIGDRIARFREFVSFRPEAIQIEMVLAVKRSRRYCDCTPPRLAVKSSTLWDGWLRSVLVCPVSSLADGRATGFADAPSRPDFICPEAGHALSKHSLGRPLSDAAALAAASTLTVRELKRELEICAISTEGCLDKEDLLERLTTPNQHQCAVTCTVCSKTLPITSSEVFYACAPCGRRACEWCVGKWAHQMGTPSCGFNHALPECHCGLPAAVRTKKQDGAAYYTCSHSTRARLGLGGGYGYGSSFWRGSSVYPINNAFDLDPEMGCDFLDWNGPRSPPITASSAAAGNLNDHPPPTTAGAISPAEATATRHRGSGTTAAIHAAASAAVGRSAPPFSAGQSVRYSEASGSLVAATVLTVHLGSLDDTHYTIRLADGTERGTVHARLTDAIVSPSPPPPPLPRSTPLHAPGHQASVQPTSQPPSKLQPPPKRQCQGLGRAVVDLTGDSSEEEEREGKGVKTGVGGGVENRKGAQEGREEDDPQISTSSSQLAVEVGLAKGFPAVEVGLATPLAAHGQAAAAARRAGSEAPASAIEAPSTAEASGVAKVAGRMVDTPASQVSDVSSWSVRQLKSFLVSRGVHIDGLAEKAELVAEVDKHGGGGSGANTAPIPSSAAAVASPKVASAAAASDATAALDDTAVIDSINGSTGPNGKRGQWQVMLSGAFTPYKDQEVQWKLEEAYLRGEAEAHIVVRGAAYVVELRAGDSMVQVSNQDPARQRPVRRQVLSVLGQVNE